MAQKQGRKDTDQALTDDQVLWLARLPAIIKVTTPGGVRLITHAGLLPDETGRYHQPTKALIRNRYLRQRPDGLWRPTGSLFHGPEDRFWTTLWTGPRVIYGHEVVADRATPRVENNTYGIDTGCVFGGRLTAYVETFEMDGSSKVEFVQVQAQREYYAYNSTATV